MSSQDPIEVRIRRVVARSVVTPVRRDALLEVTGKLLDDKQAIAWLSAYFDARKEGHALRYEALDPTTMEVVNAEHLAPGGQGVAPQAGDEGPLALHKHPAGPADEHHLDFIRKDIPNKMYKYLGYQLDALFPRREKALKATPATEQMLAEVVVLSDFMLGEEQSHSFTAPNVSTTIYPDAMMYQLAGQALLDDEIRRSLQQPPAEAYVIQGGFNDFHAGRPWSQPTPSDDDIRRNATKLAEDLKDIATGWALPSQLILFLPPMLDYGEMNTWRLDACYEVLLREMNAWRIQCPPNVKIFLMKNYQLWKPIVAEATPFAAEAASMYAAMQDMLDIKGTNVRLISEPGRSFLSYVFRTHFDLVESTIPQGGRTTIHDKIRALEKVEKWEREWLESAVFELPTPDRDIRNPTQLKHMLGKGEQRIIELALNYATLTQAREAVRLPKPHEIPWKQPGPPSPRYPICNAIRDAVRQLVEATEGRQVQFYEEMTRGILPGDKAKVKIPQQFHLHMTTDRGTYVEF